MRWRRITQFAGLLLFNPWFVYFSTRTIYQGDLKGVCCPVFNCHACPLAVTSCPIGSLQHSCATLSFKDGGFAQASKQGVLGAVSPLLYVAGFLAIIGLVTGRLFCGWLCPFGLLQDLLYKIRSPKFRLPAWTRFGKYFFLVVVAMLIPFITGVNWFSRLCPAGALEGAIPLKTVKPAAPLPAAGWFFWLKIAILVFFLAWMITTKRPFCRVVCPLGAVYALFNRVSLYRMEVDPEKCNECLLCREVCPVDINIFEDPNSPECIRCLECKRACPSGAITSGFRFFPRRGTVSPGD